ncbi:MAG: DUF4197 domain-containing protein [Paludibacteraceae bacterium]|nr:DUF4197 domain-containing protein [Paludibacteraceae bacterium]
MGLLGNIVSSLSSVASEAIKNGSAQELINSITGANCGSFDIGSGLKAALKVGIETAAKNLGAEDGYLADAAVRIGLPKEAVTTFGVVQSLSSNPSFNSMLNATGLSIPDSDTIIKLFNRAAENAAPKSIDIFVNAITNISFADAEKLLFGEDNAATTYLHANTFTQLQDAFVPSITDSLNTIKVANVTPTDAWNTYATYNNKLVDILDSGVAKMGLEMARKLGVLSDEQFEKIRTIDCVNPNLSGYITGEALTGLFSKVSEKEYDIRHNASARVSDVLQSVFGRLDNRG